MGEARNFKFGTIIDHPKPLTENAKLGQNGLQKGHVTYFWNFGTPSVTSERVKLETSNFSRLMLITRGINEKM